MDIDAIVHLEDPLPQRCHRRVDENRLGFGVVDDVGHLVRGEMGVDGAVVQPGKLAAPSDFEKLRTIRQHQGDPVTAAQPRLVKQGGDALAALVQLAVRNRPTVGDDQGGRVRLTVRVVANVHERGSYVAAPSVDAAACRLAISDGSTLSLNTR